MNYKKSEVCKIVRCNECRQEIFGQIFEITTLYGKMVYCEQCYIKVNERMRRLMPIILFIIIVSVIIPIFIILLI